MKRIKNLALLVIFIFSSLLLQFCNRCKDKGGVSRMSVEKFTFSAPFKNKVTRQLLPIDSIEMNTGDSLHFQLLAETRHAMNKGNGGNLYACDPNFIYERMEPDSLRVISLDHFDSGHPAGSNISAFFLVSSYSNIFDYYSLKNYTSLRNLQSYNDVNFTLTLLKKPAKNILHIKLFFYTNAFNDGIVTESPAYTFKH